MHPILLADLAGDLLDERLREASDARIAAAARQRRAERGVLPRAASRATRTGTSSLEVHAVGSARAPTPCE